MRGVVFLGDKQLELRHFPDPEPGPRQVLVQIKASGMCGSDLHGYRRPAASKEAIGGLPRGEFIAGHEPCGVIAGRGSAVTEDEAPIGQRVMIHHYFGCGRCKHCLTGWNQLCLKGTKVQSGSAHGGHADYIVANVNMLVPLIDELSYEEGAAVACGTGTAYSALRRIEVSGRDTLVIMGQGPVGVSATMLAKAMGARVIAVDMTPERLAIAKEFGADITLNSKDTDVVKAVHELTHGEGANIALDCTGRPEPRQWAVRSTRTWGKTCFVGEGGDTTFDISRDMLRRELTIFASWTFSTVIQAECAQFVADRKLPLKSQFTHRYTTLDDADGAYKLFDTQTTGKGVFLL
ncbi:MAG: zinc-binding dehydrogenase [Chloroflexota bacterium]